MHICDWYLPPVFGWFQERYILIVFDLACKPSRIPTKPLTFPLFWNPPTNLVLIFYCIFKKFG